jgi:1,4-dihydroxy-2-naphthoate octaprenyltransferase
VDLREGELPVGYDGVLFAHFLDIFSPENVARFLARAFACLPDGGAVCVLGSAMDDDERGPLMHGVLSAYFLCLADGEGRFYTARQMEDAMRAAGFTDITRTALPRSEVLVRGIKRTAPARSAVLRARLAAFVRLGRPEFLAYSLLLYGLGSAAFAAEGRAIALARWAHGLAFVWAAHLMTHYCNERFDLPADAKNLAPTRWTGGSRVLVEGRLTPAVSLVAALVLLLVATVLALAMPVGAARAVALGTMTLAWFYTAPPIALNYRCLGEVTVASVLCVAVPLLAFTLQRGAGAPSGVLVAALAPLFVAQAARMLVMNLADHDGDLRAGKRTLAVALGPRWARRAVAVAQVVVYGAILALAAVGALPAHTGTMMTLTAPLGGWLALRLLFGAPRTRAEANSVAFWASTQVALLALAATVGLLAPARAPAPSLALCAAIVALFGVLLALQIRRHFTEVRP